jgi:cytochrome P450
VNYNPFNAELQADPFPAYRWMRDRAPVYRSQKWRRRALSRFEDVRAAALDPDTFRSLEGIDNDDTAKGQSGAGFLPDIDNPRHSQLRKIVQPHFLPRRIGAPDDSIRKVVRGLVASWRDRGEAGLAQELAWPMPFRVFFNLVSLPAARERGASGWTGCRLLDKTRKEVTREELTTD